ncbi:MAG: hypothetical protein U0792_03965 [Gemmataceae bacterium]
MTDDEDDTDEPVSLAQMFFFGMLMLSVLVKTVLFFGSLNKPDTESNAQQAYANYLKHKEIEEHFQNPAWPNRPGFTKPVISPAMKQAMADTRPIFAAFLKEIQADNLSAAYCMASESFRERVGQEDFEILICNHPQIKQAPQTWLLGNQSPGGSITVHMTMSAPDGTEIVISAKHTSHGWMIDDFSITKK